MVVNSIVKLLLILIIHTSDCSAVMLLIEVLWLLRHGSGKKKGPGSLYPCSVFWSLVTDEFPVDGLRSSTAC